MCVCVTRFRSYLNGHHFSLITDHKPLQSLLSGNKPVPVQASGRIQRWAITLASFEHTLEFCCTNRSRHGNAEALGQLPFPEQPTALPVPAKLVLLIQYLENVAIKA